MITCRRASSMNTPLVAGFNAKRAGLERAPGAGSVSVLDRCQRLIAICDQVIDIL
jgi:hypothetical protein